MAGPQPYIPPPPPPPPYGYYEGAPSAKPTSGKAIASLICGLVGFLVICYVPGIAALVGVVLGILAIIETGAEGKRSGRGLAIAGTIVSVLAVFAMAGWIGFLVYATKQVEENIQQAMKPALDADQQLILKRLKLYHDSNNRSLGPGGPVVAGDRGFAPTPGEGNQAPLDTRPRVSGALELRHLVDEHEISWGATDGAHGGNQPGWRLTINGKSSATLRATDWNGEVIREVEIRDVGRDDYIVTVQ